MGRKLKKIDLKICRKRCGGHTTQPQSRQSPQIEKATKNLCFDTNLITSNCLVLPLWSKQSLMLICTDWLCISPCLTRSKLRREFEKLAFIFFLMAALRLNLWLFNAALSFSGSTTSVTIELCGLLHESNIEVYCWENMKSATCVHPCVHLTPKINHIDWLVGRKK